MDLLPLHSHDDAIRDVLIAKGVSMVVLFIASMICGFAPMVLAKWLKWISTEEAGNLRHTNRIVMGLLSFGGGVLFSTTFMHLIPEVDHNIWHLVQFPPEFSNIFSYACRANPLVSVMNLKICVIMSLFTSLVLTVTRFNSYSF